MPDIPFLASPNSAAGRHGGQIMYVILDTTECSYDDAVKQFQDPKSRLSCNYLVGLDGRASQFVKDEDRSFYFVNMSTTSIGIAHEGYNNADKPWVTPEMWEKSLSIAADICKRYSVPVQNIIGHSDRICKMKGCLKDGPGEQFSITKYRLGVTGLLLANS